MVPAGWALGQSFSGRLQSAQDGDTIRLLRETGQIVQIDLYGIDAPELGQPHGPTAARAVRRVIGQRRVRAVAEGRDEDGRPLFVVRVGDRSVNEHLVRRGHAWWDHRRAASNDRLRHLQSRAQANERGLWARRAPVPPWKWRAQRESTGRP